MKVIGITGPTGAGKTTTLNALRDLGCEVIDADRVYHELLRDSSEMRETLVSAFGGGILDGTGAVDRRRLAEAVYPDRLEEVGRVTHPLIGAEVRRRIEAARKAGKPGVAIDAIALMESGLAGECDRVVSVLAPLELRIRRIMARDGIDEGYARRRALAQKGDEFFRSHSDFVLENTRGDTPEVFEARARDLFEKILSDDGFMRENVISLERSKNSIPSEEVISMETEKQKTPGQLRRAALMDERKNGYDRLTPVDEAAMFAYCEEYKKFLDAAKTEREAVDEVVRLAQARGFTAFTRGMTVQPGDKVYRVNRGKSVMLAVIGQKSLADGVSIGAAHIDSPRLDLKPQPLYEDSELGFLKTHYYGGIRKYQWVTIPLELHGIIVKADGSSVKVAIGASEGDPLFTVDDLLPHLGAEQGKKALNEAIPGENLNLLVGSRPFRDDEGSDRVKLAILDILNQKYDITEADFISAELEVVPAFKATDIGFDRSLIGAYGQDDRVCAYACLAALLDTENPMHTAVCMLADKEEIGSEGVSGMKSAAFDTFMSDLCDAQRVPLKTCYEHSFCLSADVTAAYDPNFAEVFEKRNSARVNYGMGFCKYTGARGKSGASDASAEVVGFVRRTLDAAGVIWQMTELGKVDAGGGGTVACYMAERDIDTLDAGVPVLSMHAPLETTGKLDCYMTYKGMKAVYQAG